MNEDTVTGSNFFENKINLFKCQDYIELISNLCKQPYISKYTFCILLCCDENME